MSLMIWGGLLVVSAYMTWKNIENLNKKSLEQLEKEMKPKLIP